MTDPKRWLEDASFASSLEHELVRSSKRLRPARGHGRPQLGRARAAARPRSRSREPGQL